MQHESDYRYILRKKLSERARSNPNYSLRAFARDLNLSPSRLSQVLQGKQGLSEETASNICQQLSLSPSEAEYFVTLVSSTDARSKVKRAIAKEKLLQKYSDHNSARTIDLDIFSLIADSYHYALLELTNTKNFRSDPAWIAKRLGISSSEAQSAIERLMRLKLLKEVRNRLVQTHNNLATPTDIPSEALRKFHQQILAGAQRALDQQLVDERDFSSLTVSIHAKDLPKFKKHIAAFRRSFNQFAEASEKVQKSDEVYSLGIQFYRLTEKDVI